jgi:glycosyltransferase involved in cell wall biosynthesis
MNILFLYDGIIDPIKGGIEKVTYTLANYFEENKKNKVYFLGLDRGHIKGNIDERQYFLPNNTCMYNPVNIDYINTFLKKYNIDVVINQGGTSPDISQLAYFCKISKLYLISVIHNSPLGTINQIASRFPKLFKYKFVLFFIKIAYKYKYKNHYISLCNNSDKVLLLSERLKDELLFFTGKRKNIISIPNPVPFTQSINQIELKKKKEILYVGRIDFTQKRIDLLLDIWACLFQKFPEWNLRIIGDGPDLDNAKNLVKKLNLSNIEFMGFQEPQQYYAEATLFCMTSSYEGFPMVLVEAMQYGCIPFAFNSFPAVYDIIDDKLNGFIINKFDINEYVSLLSIIMNDTNKISHLGDNAIEKSNIFNIQKIGQKWDMLLEDYKL